MHVPRLRTLTLSVLSVLLVFGAVACSDSDDEPAAAGTGPDRAAAASRYTTPLGGICPDPVVVQTSWWPEVDYGATYQLLGPDPVIDEDGFAVTGPLGATGVSLEIRSGGPALGFQSATSLLEQDDDILLGYLDLDESIENSGSHPTVAVLAPYAKSPLMYFWGDQSWDFASLADIGLSGETVLTLDETYTDVFVGEGLFQRSQVDTSYTGDIDRFVAEDGRLVQVGFVTDEPYRLGHDVKAWAKPVEYVLTGEEYPAYANVLAIRQDRLADNRECLSRLVPLFQQAVRDYVADPGPANELMIDVTGSLDTAGYSLSPGLLADGNAKQRKLGLIANGPDGVLGSFDTARVQELIDRLTPVLTADDTPPKPGVRPADVVTAEFIDPEVALD